VRPSGGFLEYCHLHEDTDVKIPATGDDSCVYDRCQETSMHASSRAEVPPMVRSTIGTSEVMIGVFLGRRGLTCIDTLDPKETFTRDHFISFVLSNLKKYAQNLRR
jgi:hypothetical protein